MKVFLTCFCFIFFINQSIAQKLSFNDFNYLSIPIFFNDVSDISAFIETRDLSVSKIISPKPDENTLPHIIFISNDKTESLVYYVNSNSLISSIVYYLGYDKEKVENFRKDLMGDTDYVKVDSRIDNDSFVDVYKAGDRSSETERTLDIVTYLKEGVKKYYIKVDGYHPYKFLRRYKELE
ncbi:hypothetical protein [Flavobacterium sp. HSC-61S13]|uniref:hypothetical protein n=1 Tax=Flavobacterium sp. HSC-61S13 TaxID=2910963 RepID=UPI00209FD0F8|nr:hypothetical protein [Flavobacterium sp. HSC-61S13]MCP1996612.1 hypothetical protein [Flavobacterium sp. HSC-61S13]